MMTLRRKMLGHCPFCSTIRHECHVQHEADSFQQGVRMIQYVRMSWYNSDELESIPADGSPQAYWCFSNPT